MALKINSSDPNFYELFERLLGRRATRVEDATKVSADIIGKVRKSGDEALIKLTKELDGLDLTSTGLIIDGNEIDEAINRIIAKAKFLDIYLSTRVISEEVSKRLPPFC